MTIAAIAMVHALTDPPVVKPAFLKNLTHPPEGMRMRTHSLLTFMLIMGCGIPLPMGNLWGLGAMAGNTVTTQIQHQQSQEAPQHRATKEAQQLREPEEALRRPAESEVQRLVAEGQQLAEAERQQELAAQEQVHREVERKRREALMRADQPTSEDNLERAQREENSQAVSYTHLTLPTSDLV